jgi:hypothetical protein
MNYPRRLGVWTVVIVKNSRIKINSTSSQNKNNKPDPRPRSEKAFSPPVCLKTRPSTLLNPHLRLHPHPQSLYPSGQAQQHQH